MNKWFECKISYEKISEDGSRKKFTTACLVDALSFSEAEARIVKEAAPYISGEFDVVGVKRARCEEVFLSEEGNRFYKAKISMIVQNKEGGAKRLSSPVQMIAQASNIHEAISVIVEGMRGTMVDYVINSVSETALMDVFPYIKEVN